MKKEGSSADACAPIVLAGEDAVNAALPTEVCMHGRVTAGAAEAVEADHPAAAWKEVLRRAGAERQTSGLSGPRMFGLDNPAIARLIQALPNAGQCTSFDAWLGERPPFVPLVRPHLVLDPLNPETKQRSKHGHQGGLWLDA